MGNVTSKFRKATKLLLWYQFIRKGMFSPLLRYYGGVWLTTLGVVAVSLSMLMMKPQATVKYGGPWLPTAVCAGVIVGGYLLGRLLGPMPVILVGIVLPAILIITPTIIASSHPGGSQDGGGPGPALSTGDMGMLIKGIGVCSALTSLAYLVYRLSQVFCKVLGLGRLSFRRVMVWVIVISSVVALELMRIVLPLAPSFRPPWQQIIAAVLEEPGWPQALALWVWINLALLLAYYDDRLIPYLLHRIGHTWAPNQIGLGEAYMVDSLLASLAKEGADEARGRSRHRRSGHSRRVA